MAGHETNRQDSGLASLGGSLYNSFVTNNSHASWQPRVIHNRLNFPTAEEAAYLWLFCERVANIVEDIAFSYGAVSFLTSQEQVESQAMTNFKRYIFDAVPGSSKLRPVISEFGRFFTLGSNPQNVPFMEAILNSLPKGLRIVSRHLTSWDKFRVKSNSGRTPEGFACAGQQFDTGNHTGQLSQGISLLARRGWNV